VLGWPSDGSGGDWTWLEIATKLAGELGLFVIVLF